MLFISFSSLIVLARTSSIMLSKSGEILALFFFSFLFQFIFYIGVYLIYSVVLVSGVQESDLVIHIHMSIIIQILFLYRLLQSIE